MLRKDAGTCQGFFKILGIQFNTKVFNHVINNINREAMDLGSLILLQSLA